MNNVCKENINSDNIQAYIPWFYFLFFCSQLLKNVSLLLLWIIYNEKNSLLSNCKAVGASSLLAVMKLK